MPSRRTRLVVTLVVGGALAAGCTSDDPEQTLPCAFYENQVDTGAVDIDDVPGDVRDDVRNGCPTTTSAQP